jgi:hypothetical protein
MDDPTLAQPDAYSAALSELLAVVDVLLETKSGLKSKRGQALMVLVLTRMRQLHRRLSPLHSFTDGEIEHVVTMLEKSTDVTRDPKLNPVASGTL